MTVVWLQGIDNDRSEYLLYEMNVMLTVNKILKRFAEVVAVLVCLLFVPYIYGTETPTTGSNVDRLFIENKGQLGDQEGKPNHDVRYLIVRPGLNIQLKRNGFSYDSYVVERTVQHLDTNAPTIEHDRIGRFDSKLANDSTTYRYHRVDIELVGSNPQPHIEVLGQSSDYLNYYTHVTQQVHGEVGATFVRGYSRVMYRDIWPNIDMEWFVDSSGNPEYQFMIRPGGDVRQIRLRYHGADSTLLLGDAIMIHVNHGPIRESIPKSFYATSNQSVKVRYTTFDSYTYGFTIDHNDLVCADFETLVIDPTPERLWGTYYGGGSTDYAYAITSTSSSDIVLAGYTQSANNISTSGAHQQTFAGLSDGYVALLTAAGVRLWGTFYGGSGVEMFDAVAMTPKGDIVSAGRTGSTAGIATIGAHQQYRNGASDAFVTVFAVSGVRRWATYYGGERDEDVVTIAVTPSGGIALAGTTNSDNGIATPGVHQASRGGYYDSYLVVFTDTGVRRWGTYYGGAVGNDRCYSIAVTPTGDIVIAGITSSAAGIATQGTHQQSYSGNDDAYVALFTDAGVRRWGSYYGGEDREDGSAVAITPNGDIALAGWTSSVNSIATPGVHKTAIGGSSDAYLALFTATGIRLWGTYYGGEIADVCEAIAVTPTGEIVIAGGTGSTVGISTPGAHQESYRGIDGDAFLSVFTAGCRLVWGTYYGGEQWEDGAAVAVTPTGKVVLAGSTGSANGIATRGAQQESLVSTNDAFVALFGAICIPPGATIVSSVPVGIVCQEQTMTLTVSAGAASSVRWTPPKHGTIITGTITDTIIAIRWSSVGIDTLRLRLVNISDSTCYRDTTIIIEIKPLPKPVVKGAAEVCQRASERYRVPFVLGHTYLWSVPKHGQIQGTATADSVTIVWGSSFSGIDTIRVRQTNTATGCSKDTFMLVRINARPAPVVTGASTACTQVENVYSVGNSAGLRLQWTLPAQAEIVGGTLTSPSLRVRWLAPGTHTLRVQCTVPSTGCASDTSLTVVVSQTPTVDLTGVTSLCLSQSRAVAYSVPQAELGSRYVWTITPISYGRIVKGDSTHAVEIDWLRRGSASLRVRVVSPAGCARDSTIQISVQDSLAPTVTSMSGLSMCEGDSLVLDAGSGYQSYMWFEGLTQVGTSRYYTTRKAATYTVRVGDGNCSGTSSSVTTIVNQLPTASVTEAQPGILTVTTDAGAAEYQWYDASVSPWQMIVGETQQTFAPPASGTYGVDVVNTSTSCKNRSASYTITIGPPPTDPVITSLTPSVTICAGEQATLRVRVAGGKQPYSYSWSDGTNVLASTDTLATIAPITSVTVSCVVTDADNKRDTATMSVQVLPRPVAEITESPRGTLVASPALADRYQWYDSTYSTIIGATQQTYQPATSGTYAVEVIMQGCADTSDVYVYDAPPRVLLAVQDHDFGSLPIDDLINASGGHPGSVWVRNLTGESLELTGASTIDTSAFSIPNQWPRRMSDGDTAQIAVRFRPTQRQTYSTPITVQTSTIHTGSATLTGAGRDLLADERVTQIVLSPVRREVEPGDTISVLLVTSIERPVQTAGKAGKFISTIQWDNRVLEPLARPGLFYDTTGTYGIATVLNGYRQDKQQVLYRFLFRAKQSEVDTTSIIFSGAKGFLWQDDRKAYPALLDSVVRVRVCQDGGPQLVGRDVISAIRSVTPNPARDVVNVMYTAQEESQLVITSLEGTDVVSLPLAKALIPREVVLSVDRLAAGSYRMILRMNGGIDFKSLIVIP